MVQPKTPPLSIRIPAELLAAIDEMADRRGMKRHAAIIWALSQGVAADRGFTPELLAGAAKMLASIPTREPLTATEVMARRRNHQTSVSFVVERQVAGSQLTGVVERAEPEKPAPKPWRGGHPKPGKGKR